MVPMNKYWEMTDSTSSINVVVEPASPSENSSVDAGPAKRKRASKPKVRTGCITCRIRRVKCDETKPSCTRCESTGRKCDGYGGAAPPRQRKRAPQSSVPLPLPPYAPTSSPSPLVSPTNLDPYLSKRHGYAAAYRRSGSNLRPLAADIEGTEEERLFFHRFRLAAEAGLAMHASSLGPGFWRRLVPQVGQSDPAVRHALIALGAAYQSAQLRQEQEERMRQLTVATTSTATTRSGKSPGLGGPPRGGTPDSYISTPPPEDDENQRHYQRLDQLELFMIQQYNLSIYHLQQHVRPGSPPSSVEVTLICCLVFVCVETSRGDEAAALAHVANGLQIIHALPPDFEPAEVPATVQSSSSMPSATSGSPPRMLRADWRRLLDFFLGLGPSAATYGFTSSEPPTPPCPPVGTWENPLEYSDELVPRWDIDDGKV
ncbi:uncharacterized protein F4822DRAFT_416684 [Hypoxylon trugodes]|uniref:uncharacterized protein n=1 Tax=Hypoxylon trugodes TaxID=326681 RepID=UPI0021923177|nr:uncharacterized protein F4822DRAFT_416684 [Hypoxylon trugodes]KAI1384916.1 hypothetical protein F4822DRAFT_416684 [Hypoxylon trugodes]